MLRQACWVGLLRLRHLTNLHQGCSPLQQQAGASDANAS